ncbi:MAG: serine protease, partial [Candidatus Competibacter sp.]|nr:serine protease [Candidatus Competibacter sp.]
MALDLKSQEVARKVAAALEATPENQRDEWFLPTLAEASLGLGDWDAVERNIKAYVANRDTKAFLIASTLRQFREVWDLENVDDRGRGIVAALRARLLELPGGGLDLSPTELHQARTAPLPAEGQLQAMLGVQGPKTFRWWKTGLERAVAVASIRQQLGGRIGTGFLVRAGDFGLDPKDELLVLTNFHVVNVHGTGDGIPPAVAEIVFEVADPNWAYLVERILWTSPVERRDASLLRLKSPVTGIEPLPLAKALPILEDTPQVYIIGYPEGRDLAFSFQDNELLD